MSIYIRNNKISMFLSYSSTPGAWQLKQLRGWVPPRHHSFTSERRTLLFVSSLNKSGKMRSLLNCLGLTVRWPTSSGALSLYILSPNESSKLSILCLGLTVRWPTSSTGCGWWTRTPVLPLPGRIQLLIPS